MGTVRRPSMTVEPGTYELTPAHGTVRLRVDRAGIAKKIGHDLVIEVRAWTASVTVDADTARSTLTATVDATSLEVVQGVGGAKALSAKDKLEIVETINKKILKTKQHPTMMFKSTSVSPVDASRVTVVGNLTIAGVTRPATLELSTEAGTTAGTIKLVQSEWGIKPFSAFLGALKIKDEVLIEAQIKAHAAKS